jgi:hypothetical protein
MRRAQGLQGFLERYAELVGISDDFLESSEHPYTCKCDKCRSWWKDMGPDPTTGRYGPFTNEEIECSA